MAEIRRKFPQLNKASIWKSLTTAAMDVMNDTDSFGITYTDPSADENTKALVLCATFLIDWVWYEEDETNFARSGIFVLVPVVTAVLLMCAL